MLSIDHHQLLPGHHPESASIRAQHETNRSQTDSLVYICAHLVGAKDLDRVWRVSFVVTMVFCWSVGAFSGNPRKGE